MTTRDPRSRDLARLASQGREGAREPTQSLRIELNDYDDSDESEVEEPPQPSLALGTHDAASDERTKVESPSGRGKTPTPPRAVTRPPPIPLPNPDESEDRLGEVLGSYRVIELLGRGGMGFVYRAEHTKLGREVALKLLRGDYARRRDAVARFFQEARTVNRVRHRNIVDVTDFVELPDGTTFIIMEMLRGESLGKWARTAVELPRALAVLVQICDGLGAAHEVGVVHRDLKPDNVIVVPTSDGAELVKLLDFGVAKLLNRDDEDVGFQTVAGSVIGTPAYMSPEQAGGMMVDARSDIYSLGAIMYELFCGQPMFRGRSFGEFVRKHLTEQPVPPRQTPRGRDIDPALEAVILKALEKEPDRRYAHVFEMRDALLQLLGGMETQPPSLVALSAASGLRMSSTVSASLRPIPSLRAQTSPPPLASSSAPALGPSAAISGASISGASISGPRITPPPASPSASLLPGTRQSAPVPPEYLTGVAPVPAPATLPWWAWVAGGAVAVALGIGIALWFAGRNEPELGPTQPPAAHPIARPIETPQAQPRLIEVRFDSLPSAGVFADGRSAELCKTPCAFNIDLGDGGPSDRRTFFVRSAGYKDARVIVDLATAQREFHLTLEQEPPVTPPAAPPPVVTPEPPVIATPPTSAAADEHPTHPAPKHPGHRPLVTGKQPSDGNAKKPPEVKQPDVKPPAPKVAPEPDPVDKAPDPKNQKKPPDKIDATDTLDPFHRKK